MNPTYAQSPVMMTATGYAQFPVAPSGTNYVVPTQKAVTTTGANGATIGQSQTCGPDSRVPVVVNPTSAYASTVAAGGSTNTIMLDLRAFPADIINVDATFSTANSVPGSIAGNAIGSFYVVGIDNVNKFVYFNAFALSGAVLNFGAGMGIQWSVTFRDINAI